MSIQFRHIARAVVVSDGQILIARMKGAHSFLPGGGIEHGEGAVTALKRELREELASLPWKSSVSSVLSSLALSINNITRSIICSKSDARN